MSRVVDTSVVVKWAVREDGWEDAAALIGTALVAPDLLRAELANALWKKVRKKEILAEQALVTQSEVEASLQFVPAMPLAVRALEIGLQVDHPVYDCFFLALAEARETTLLTADKRLINKCGDTPFASLIELLPPAPIAGVET